MKILNYFVLFLFVLVMFSCGGKKSNASKKENKNTPAKIEISKEAREEAIQIFTARCVVCHGADAKGNGPASASLSPKPKDLTSKEWQTSVTDDYLINIIKYGGAAVGKSPAMPSNPDLAAKEDVLRGLVEYIRSLQKD